MSLVVMMLKFYEYFVSNIILLEFEKKMFHLFSRFDPSLRRQKLTESPKQLGGVDTWHLKQKNCPFSHVLYLCKKVSFVFVQKDPGSIFFFGKISHNLRDGDNTLLG